MKKTMKIFKEILKWTAVNREVITVLGWEN